MGDEFMIVSGGVRYRPEDAKRLKLKPDPAPAPAAAADPDPGAGSDQGEYGAQTVDLGGEPGDAVEGVVGGEPVELTNGDDAAEDIVEEPATEEKKATPRNKARSATNKG